MYFFYHCNTAYQLFYFSFERISSSLGNITYLPTFIITTVGHTNRVLAKQGCHRCFAYHTHNNPEWTPDIFCPLWKSQSLCLSSVWTRCAGPRFTFWGGLNLLPCKLWWDLLLVWIQTSLGTNLQKIHSFLDFTSHRSRDYIKNEPFSVVKATTAFTDCIEIVPDPHFSTWQRCSQHVVGQGTLCISPYSACSSTCWRHSKFGNITSQNLHWMSCSWHSNCNAVVIRAQQKCWKQDFQICLLSGLCCVSTPFI